MRRWRGAGCLASGIRYDRLMRKRSLTVETFVTALALWSAPMMNV